MNPVKTVKVCTTNLITVVESLAQEIWRQHYTPIIGKHQVEYMLETFQSKDAIARQIEKEGYLYYLLQDRDGFWVGYLGIIPKRHELFLSKLYVTLIERGKGYGRYAVEFIETIAKDLELSRITLTVNKYNTQSIKTYEKLGFIITGALVSDIGNGFVMDDYRMEKIIRL
jgi:diamine N-acetyltransferase